MTDLLRLILILYPSLPASLPPCLPGSRSPSLPPSITPSLSLPPSSLPPSLPLSLPPALPLSLLLSLPPVLPHSLPLSLPHPSVPPFLPPSSRLPPLSLPPLLSFLPPSPLSLPPSRFSFTGGEAPALLWRNRDQRLYRQRAGRTTGRVGEPRGRPGYVTSPLTPSDPRQLSLFVGHAPTVNGQLSDLEYSFRTLFNLNMKIRQSIAATLLSIHILC